MGRRDFDPGLAYLIEIGFEKIKGKYGLSDRWNRVFGKEKAEQLLASRNKIEPGTSEFYEFKNSDPEISRSLTEAYDGDIIRQACNFIDANKNSFGKTILEVGCESGYMTGFLAKTFPEAKIVSIDLSESAIGIASKRSEAMGVKNVEFRISSLKEVTEKFDTVFCMRTIQENLDYSAVNFFLGDPLYSQFDQYLDLTKEYTDLLVSRLNKNGNLCVFERIAHDPLICGWMMRLCTCECAPDLATYEEIECEEAGDTSVFQAFVCHNGTSADPQTMIDVWSKALQLNLDGRSSLSGMEALYYLNENAGKLIRGVRILGYEDKTVGRFALFHDKDDKSIVYYLYVVGDDIQLFTVNESKKEMLLQDLQDALDLNISAGLNYKVIDPDEKHLEGNN